MSLNIIVAVVYFKIIVYFHLKILRVGPHENVFFFIFSMAIKTAGSVQKVGVGRVSGNTAIFTPDYDGQVHLSQKIQIIDCG